MRPAIVRQDEFSLRTEVVDLTAKIRVLTFREDVKRALVSAVANSFPIQLREPVLVRRDHHEVFRSG